MSLRIMDVLPDEAERDRLFTFVLQNKRNAIRPLDRYGTVWQHIRIPNHGRWVEVIWNPGRRKPVKRIFKPGRI